jgi:hypothetical protein
MDEETQKETQGKKPQESSEKESVPGTDDPKDRTPAKDETETTTTELDRADQIAERQKRENDRREALLTREEALEARKTVGGITEAGQAPVKQEETPADYAKKVLANDL